MMDYGDDGGYVDPECHTYPPPAWCSDDYSYGDGGYGMDILYRYGLTFAGLPRSDLSH
jgi:hypothetical protein